MNKILFREEIMGDETTILAIYINEDNTPEKYNASGAISVFSLEDGHTSATLEYINKETKTVNAPDKHNRILEYLHNSSSIPPFDVVISCEGIPETKNSTLNTNKDEIVSLIEEEESGEPEGEKPSMR